ncbi:MAG: helix-turn-helix domain-containing protein, partial [Verrucomicrobiota bacterium]
SDCPASEISALEDRLVSRFQWGLTAAIYKPGQDTSAAILRRKRDDWGMSVSDEVIDIIVSQVNGTVRQLEGALIRVSVLCTMNKGAMDKEKIRRHLSDMVSQEDSQPLDIDEIKEAVAEHYDLTVKDLNGKGRTARVAEARQISMFLIRTLTEYSLTDIALTYGKDHGTVLYAVKKIKSKCEKSQSIANTVELLKRRLTRGGRVDPARAASNRGMGAKDYREQALDA